MFTTTIVEPIGVASNIEIIIPIVAQSTDIIADIITTILYVLHTLIDDNAGKISKADINNVPTRFIARTIITAIIIAINVLYSSVLTPVAFEKFSSKVTANILL